MWQQIKQLTEQRGQILADMKAILSKAETEKRDLTTEENAKFDELNTKAEGIQKNIERAQRVYDIEQTITGNKGTEQRIGRDDVNTPEQQADQKAQEYRAQFDQFLRGANPVELRALTVAGQGVVGDRPFYNQLVTAMKSYAGVIEAGAEVIPTTDGNPLTVPTANDTSNTGRLVAEGATNANVTEPTLGVMTLGGYKFDSDWIKVSLELLRDAGYPVETTITNMAAERLGRAFNTYATTGTGTGQPKGFTVAGTVGKTCAATNAVTYDELLDWVHSLDAAYRNGGRCRIMLADSTLAAIRKLKDGANRYIFESGAAGAPNTILGYQYVVNNDMANLSSGAASIVAAIGDFQRYKVRMVAQPELIRANELFISDGLVGFKVFQRIDGNLADTGAVKTLKLAAA